MTSLEKAGNALMKRLMDIVGSLLLSIVCSPVMLAVAIGVRLSGTGLVVFCQERVERNKKPFAMHKFRSMVDNTDHDAWAVKNDARRTGLDRFIRKYNLDELPQLFDVLVGHMSLVGPWPELPRYVRLFKEDVPLDLVRQQVRPGMTGPWPARGHVDREARRVRYLVHRELEPGAGHLDSTENGLRRDDQQRMKRLSVMGAKGFRKG